MCPSITRKLLLGFHHFPDGVDAGPDLSASQGLEPSQKPLVCVLLYRHHKGYEVEEGKYAALTGSAGVHDGFQRKIPAVGGSMMGHQIHDVLLYHHSHLDVGYTQHPTVVWARQLDYLHQAMELAERYEDGNEGERFRWVAESSAVVEHFLEQASSQDVDRLIRLTRDGSIEITAMYCNVTPLFTVSELLASLKVMVRLRTEFDVPITTAVNHDVNGESWLLPDLLRELDIDFLMMGINSDSARPPEPRPRPFWWQGFGGHQILTWNGEHYGYAQYLGIPRPTTWTAGSRDLRRSHQMLNAYLDKIWRQGYAWDAVVLSVTHTVTWDNDGPNEELVDFVRAWNHAHLRPRLKLVNPRDIRSWLARQDLQQIPVRRGDWTDWWSHGTASSARETALKGWASRVWEASRMLRATSTPMTVRDRAEFDRLQEVVARHLLLYDEHTWGSAESISHPDTIHSLGQWNSKSAHVYEAAAGVSRLWTLSTRSLASRVETTEPSVLLYNPLPWPEQIRVVLPRLRQPDDFGGAWPLQEFARDLDLANPVHPLYVAGPPIDYGLVALPACGHAVLALKPPTAQTQVQTDRWTLSSTSLTLTIDPERGGIRSLITASDGYQWCDWTSGYGIGEYVLHRLSDSKRREFLQPGTPIRDVREEVAGTMGRVTRVKDLQPIQGPGLAALRVDLEAEGTRQLAVTYTLYDTAPWIDLRVELDREGSRAIESMYLTFPMNLRHAAFHYASGGTVVEGEEEQLPNACRDYYSVDDWVDVSNTTRGMTLATPDAPLVLWGGFSVGAYAEHHRDASPLLVSWVMNNLWHTNFKADQPGPLVLRYRLHLHSGGFDAVASQRVGMGAAVPVLAGSVYRGAAGIVEEKDPVAVSAIASGLRITPDAVRIIDVTADSRSDGRLISLTWLPWTDVAEDQGQLTLDLGSLRQVGKAWQLRLDGQPWRALPVTHGVVQWGGSIGTPVSVKVWVPC